MLPSVHSHAPPSRVFLFSFVWSHQFCAHVSPCVPMQTEPMSKEQDEALRKWMDKTPSMAAAKGTGKPSTAASGKAKGDGKKKKKK